MISVLIVILLLLWGIFGFRYYRSQKKKGRCQCGNHCGACQMVASQQKTTEKK